MVRASRPPLQSLFRQAPLSERAKKKWGLRLRQERPAKGVWSGANHHTPSEKSEAPPCRSVVRARRSDPAADTPLQLPCRFWCGSYFVAVFVPEGRKNSRQSTVAEPSAPRAGQPLRLALGGRFCAACRILRRSAPSRYASGISGAMAGSIHGLTEKSGDGGGGVGELFVSTEPLRRK